MLLKAAVAAAEGVVVPAEVVLLLLLQPDVTECPLLVACEAVSVSVCRFPSPGLERARAAGGPGGLVLCVCCYTVQGVPMRRGFFSLLVRSNIA